MKREHQTLVAVLVAALIGVALFSAFSITLFHKPPAVILPSLSPQEEPSHVPHQSGGAEFTRVVVDETTVQRVVASLERPESYSRTVTTETLGQGGRFGVSTASVTVDGGWTQVTTDLPGGRRLHSIVGDGARYLWYDQDAAWQELPASAQSADLAQRLPTYEAVLEADPESILAAGYEESGGLPCIYVAVAQPELGYVESYWVSVDTGLLVCAESSREDQVFYRMSGYAVETPAAPNLNFTLPNGEVLHTTTHPD